MNAARNRPFSWRTLLWAGLLCTGAHIGLSLILGLSITPVTASGRQSGEPQPHTTTQELAYFFPSFTQTGDGNSQEFSRSFYIPTVVRPSGLVLYNAGTPQNGEQEPLINGTFYIQNLAAEPAQISLELFNGGLEATVLPPITQIISANSMRDFRGNTFAPTPFDGSVRLISNQPLAAVAVLTSNQGANGSAAYEGVDVVVREAIVPLIYNQVAGFTPYFYIQNANTGQDADTTQRAFRISFQRVNTSCVITATMKGGRRLPIEDATVTGCLPNGFHGYISILSPSAPPAPFAEVVVGNGAQKMDAFRGVSRDAASNKAVCPLVFHNEFQNENNDWTTGVWAVNIGNMLSEITLTYVKAGEGDGCTQSTTAQPNISLEINASEFLGNTAACQASAGWQGFAILTSNQPIVATATIDSNNDNATYTCINPLQGATTKLAFPFVTKNNNGYTAGIQILNAGSQDTDITCVFTNGAQASTRNAVAPDTVATFNLADPTSVNAQDSFLGAAVCTSSGSPVVGAAAVSNDKNIMTYQGFNH